MKFSQGFLKEPRKVIYPDDAKERLIIDFYKVANPSKLEGFELENCLGFDILQEDPSYFRFIYYYDMDLDVEVHLIVNPKRFKRFKEENDAFFN